MAGIPRRRRGDPAMTASIDVASLHGSLRDPVLGSLEFLNEVMGRYPDAVSFAPGAPHPLFHADLDPQRYVDRFLDHLTAERGLPDTTARRLLFEYGPSRGIINDVLAPALADEHGVAVDPDSVIVTVGAQEGMLLTLRTLLSEPGDVLAVANPCFVGITGAARILDAPVLGIPESPDGIAVDLLAEACRSARDTGRRIRICYVAPDYANPGGVRMSERCRRRLLDLAEREDFFVLEDNAYGFTRPPGPAPAPLKALDRTGRVICIGTFAKVCFPGARVGYVLADQWVDDAGTGRRQRLAALLAAVKSMVTVNTSPLCQAVIAGMLLEHGASLSRLGSRQAALYRRNLSQLLDSLQRHAGDLRPVIDWSRPDGGFFVRVTVPVAVDSGLLELSANRYGVLWTPMKPFFTDGAGDRQLRLSCSYLEPEEIETGVQRLTQFFRKEVVA